MSRSAHTYVLSKYNFIYIYQSKRGPKMPGRNSFACQNLANFWDFILQTLARHKSYVCSNYSRTIERNSTDLHSHVWTVELGYSKRFNIVKITHFHINIIAWFLCKHWACDARIEEKLFSCEFVLMEGFLLYVYVLHTNTNLHMYVCTCIIYTYLWACAMDMATGSAFRG